ncbi:MAG: ABC transporter substrate-binding protein [Chloroflexi bacterium]|nr:ABC transporter substrate-binding protein [Chloroflexota bacterium]MBV9600845.1 ABC transporter substrate-binding protein [Chloroflexota bacterium]
MSGTNTLRIGISANVLNAPLYVAIDNGLFSKAGLDVNVTTTNSSSATLLPIAARGDLDVITGTPGPALFNQVAQQLGVKAIASEEVETRGRIAAGWLLVAPEQVNTIKTVQDLRGKTIEGGVQGGAIDYLASQAVKEAGLQPGRDVTITYRVKTNTDYLVLAQNHAADVYGSFEPFATQIDQQGYAKKWLSYADVTPGYQPQLLLASPQYLSGSFQALSKFLEVYLAVCRDINAANGAWAPQLVDSVSKAMNNPPETILAEGGVPFYDPNGTVNTDSLTSVQEFWVQTNQVQTPVAISDLVDTTAVEDALQRLGRG